MCELVKRDDQYMGCLYCPRDLSQSNTRPGLSLFSAPTTNATSASPDEMYENAETMQFVPELQRLSTEWAVFGEIPANSEIMFARYFSLEFVEVRTTSISFCVKFLVLSKIGLIDEIMSDSIEMSSFVNLVKPDAAIPTFLKLHLPFQCRNK